MTFRQRERETDRQTEEREREREREGQTDRRERVRERENRGCPVVFTLVLSSVAAVSAFFWLLCCNVCKR